MKLIENDKNVCVEIEEYKDDLSEYSFVIMRGTLQVVTSQQERERALKKLVEDGENRFSKNFLPAHGFKKENGWSSLASIEKSLVVIKLENVMQEIGLKSP